MKTTHTICALSAFGAVSASLIGPAVAAGYLRHGSPVDFKASIEVIETTPEKIARCEANTAAGAPCLLLGYVFEDHNRDGKRQRFERGVPGVSVSNGLDVVRTDGLGRYQLPIHEQAGGTTVFITKPAGYQLPVDEQNVPQFFYHHVPNGSPALRFGGLPATGALPRAVNFPLVKTANKKKFKIVVSGDTQPYSNNEVGYVRDSLAKEAAELEDIELVMIEGDIVGDDLGLFPRFKEIMSVVGAPLYFVGGNHDLDFDAATDDYSFDTFRREWGPEYYSFDMGDVHFVGLDNVRYPCTPDVDNADGLHGYCNDPVGAPTYNGYINQEQLEWLYNDLSNVAEDKLIVLNMHIPLVTYIDQYATKHQTTNAGELYALLANRKVLSFSGHTHTIEQLLPGDEFEGWNQAFGAPHGPVPFHQIVAGATSGSWWGGDFDFEQIPEATDRLGAPRGFYVIEFDGNRYQDTYKASTQPIERQMSVSFLSPTFQAWYDAMATWMNTPASERPATTPVGINDLPDTNILTASDLSGGVKLVVNVWNGSTSSDVWAQFDNGYVAKMTQTQAARGEGFVDALDPWALERQLYVLRYAIRSTSGEPRAQGFEQFRGSANIGDPGPISGGNWTTRSPHLWTLEVPDDFSAGAHTVRVVTVDRYGRDFEETVTFEVMDERPPPYFRSEIFE